MKIKTLLLVVIIFCFTPSYSIAEDKLALTKTDRTYRSMALELIKADTNLDRFNKILLYKSLIKSNLLTEYENFLLKNLLYNLEKNIYEQIGIVFTGTLCSGKSTILELFREENYAVMPEVAADIITQENKKPNEEDRILPWRGDVNRLMFQENVAKEQIARELEIRNNYIYFLDRGLWDGIAYLLNSNKGEEKSSMFDFIFKFSLDYKYQLVFYFDPTDNLENNEIRTENDSFRREIAKRIKEVYSLHYQYIVVPLLSVDDRFNFIKLFIPKTFFGLEIKKLSIENFKKLNNSI